MFLISIGLGIVFYFKRTNGGSDIIVQIINKYSNISVGTGILTVVTKKEVAILRQLVQRVDPGAFMIISNMHEVLGEGFVKRT